MGNEILYRLKAEAQPYFSKECGDAVETMEWWESNNVAVTALVETNLPYIKMGHYNISDKNGTEINEHTVSLFLEQKSEFYFTVVIPSVSLVHLIKLNAGWTQKNLKNRLQVAVNEWFNDIKRIGK